MPEVSLPTGLTYYIAPRQQEDSDSESGSSSSSTGCSHCPRWLRSACNKMKSWATQNPREKAAIGVGCALCVGMVIGGFVSGCIPVAVAGTVGAAVSMGAAAGYGVGQSALGRNWRWPSFTSLGRPSDSSHQPPVCMAHAGLANPQGESESRV